MRQIIVYYVVLLWWPIVAFAQKERDFVRASPPITVDGDLADWDGHPYVVWGCGMPAEAELSAIVRTAWSAVGLAIALRVYDPKGAPGREDVLDLFLDTRQFTERMDDYAAGVYHFTIRPAMGSGGDVNISQVDQHNQPVANLPCIHTRGAVRVLKDGWAAEYVLPWAAIGMTVPASSRWIAFSARISRGRASGKQGLSIGAASRDQKNALETTPIAFSPVRLAAAATQAEPISFRAEEVLIQGEPWLEVEAVAPTETMELAHCSLVVTGLHGNISLEAPFLHSSSGIFWRACDRFLLSSIQFEGSSLSIGLEIPGKTWNRQVSVSASVAARHKEIDLMLPDRLIGDLAPNERAVAMLLKVCAKESANLLCTADDRRRPPQKVFRAVSDPNLYDVKIALFTQLASQFLHGKKIDAQFPCRAWCSALDGSWLPIKVIYPWNYDSSRNYPARLVINGLNRTATRAQFIENELIAFTQNQYSGCAGDYFSVVLYGRGNSHLRLGEEELGYVFDTLLPSLGVDMRRVSIYGGSHGGAVALELALRHPDRFAWIYSRAGGMDSFVEENIAPALAGQLENLSNSAVYLTAGEEDKAIAQSNQSLYDALRSHGVLCLYNERAATGHLFAPEVPPPAIAEQILPTFPSHVSFATATLNANKSFWLTIQQIPESGETGQVCGDIRDGNRITITTKRTNAFSVDLTGFKPTKFPLQVSVDNQPLIEVPHDFSNTRVDFVLAGVSWIIRHAENGTPSVTVKRHGLCGPASEIENGRLSVIYGTKDPARTRVLRERAFKIVRERVGTEIAQWGGGHFTIKADVEVTPVELTSNNLWLIGSPAENAVVALFENRLPIKLNSEGLDIGSIHLSSPNLLVSYIYPSFISDHYLYFEMGRSNLAYDGDIIPAPNSDICVQEVGPYRTQLLLSTLFGANWEFTLK